MCVCVYVRADKRNENIGRLIIIEIIRGAKSSKEKNNTNTSHSCVLAKDGKWNGRARSIRVAEEERLSGFWHISHANKIFHVEGKRDRLLLSTSSWRKGASSDPILSSPKTVVICSGLFTPKAQTFTFTDTYTHTFRSVHCANNQVSTASVPWTCENFGTVFYARTTNTPNLIYKFRFSFRKSLFSIQIILFCFRVFF